MHQPSAALASALDRWACPARLSLLSDLPVPHSALAALSVSLLAPLQAPHCLALGQALQGPAGTAEAVQRPAAGRAEAVTGSVQCLQAVPGALGADLYAAASLCLTLRLAPLSHWLHCC